jgi:hypothetical protein
MAHSDPPSFARPHKKLQLTQIGLITVWIVCLPLTLPYGFHFAYHPGVSEIDLQIALIKADSVDVNKLSHPPG